MTDTKLKDIPMVIEKKPILSEGFRNFIFLLCIFSCIAVTGMNSYVTRIDQNLVRGTFEDLRLQAVQAQQISVAQEYAMQIGVIAEYQTTRAHELEQKGEQIVKRFIELSQQVQNLKFTSEVERVAIQAQSIYIKQLTEFIEANNLAAPQPDMNRVFEEAANDNND